MPSKIWFVTFSRSEPWRELEGWGNRGSLGRRRPRGGRIHFLYGLLCNQESHVNISLSTLFDATKVHLLGSKGSLYLQPVPQKFNLYISIIWPLWIKSFKNVWGLSTISKWMQTHVFSGSKFSSRKHQEQPFEKINVPTIWSLSDVYPQYKIHRMVFQQKIYIYSMLFRKHIWQKGHIV